MKNILFITITSLIFFHGCAEYTDDPLCSEYKYLTFEEFRNSVVSQSPKEIDNAGKIYIYEDLLLVNEVDRGVHIIDNYDKQNPVPKAFVKIYGNVDIAVKDGYMYVDSYMDLVVVDIRDLDNIQEVNRTKDVFYFTDNDIYEECDYDTTNGIVVKAD